METSILYIVCLIVNCFVWYHVGRFHGVRWAQKQMIDILHDATDKVRKSNDELKVKLGINNYQNKGGATN